jgi:hypothetical protein
MTFHQQQIVISKPNMRHFFDQGRFVEGFPFFALPPKNILSFLKSLNCFARFMTLKYATALPIRIAHQLL